VVRASKGTLFQVPVVEAGTQETLAWLKARGIRLAAATPAGAALHWAADLGGALAIAVGTEKEGLSDAFLAAAEVRVLVYEALRQRAAARR
jgi:TrmH family RNA methyltransferase